MKLKHLKTFENFEEGNNSKTPNENEPDFWDWVFKIGKYSDVKSNIQDNIQDIPKNLDNLSGYSKERLYRFMKTLRKELDQLQMAINSNDKEAYEHTILVKNELEDFKKEFVDKYNKNETIKNIYDHFYNLYDKMRKKAHKIVYGYNKK